jgi:hypothetical protein
MVANILLALPLNKYKIIPNTNPSNKNMYSSKLVEWPGHFNPETGYQKFAYNNKQCIKRK